MTNEERKVFELALEALLKTQNEGFNLPGSAIREAITAIKEALAQPKKLDQDEVDIRSRLYQRIHELETQLAQPEQEPCKTCNGAGEVETGIGMMVCDDCHGITYTNPPQRKEPEQEPVANVVLRDGLPTLLANNQIKPTDERLYTTPPQRTFVGLTNEEMEEVRKQAVDLFVQEVKTTGKGRNEPIKFGRLVEAKLKEKNT